MRPFRKSNGYDNNGKKKVIRYFRLEKIKNKKTDVSTHEQSNHLPSNHEQ